MNDCPETPVNTAEFGARARPLRRIRRAALALAVGCAGLPALALAQQPGETREVTTFKFLDAPPAWVIVLVIVPLVLGFVAFIYRREGHSAPLRARFVCGALRALAFAVLFLFLFRPVFETQAVETELSVVPILIDASSSMQRPDSYVDPQVAARLAELSGLTGAADVAQTARIDLVKAILARAQGDPRQVMKDRNHVRFFSFGEELRALDTPDDVRAEGNYTRLGSAIADALAEESSRGDRVAEMIVISDGRSNSGLDVAEAASLASLDGVRILTLGVGDPNEPKNVEILSVRAPDVALVNDDVAFEVVIASKGYEDRVTSLLLKARDSSQILASADVRLAGAGAEQTEVLFWRPEREGEYDLEISVAQLPGEQFPDDNTRRHHLRVDPEEIRVLYVEGYPRWEYRFLKNILLRAKNMKAQCLLLDADRDFIQESSDGLPALTAFPPERKDLFEYDVVILGDVNPWQIRATAEQSDQALQNLKEFVELGGGLIMVAGELDSPRSYVGTKVEDVLPIVVGDPDEERRNLSDGILKPFRPKIADPFNPHEVVRLEKDPKMNRDLWEDPDYGLPPQEWYFPVRKAKGGAEVMLVHPENKNQYGAHVLMASTFYPAGRTMFIAFDSTWRWRKFYGDRYTERFWRGAVRYVALNKLRRTNKRFELLTDKTEYDINEPIRLSARIRDVDFNPIRDETFKAQLADENGRVSSIDLTNVDPQEGLFKGTIHTGLPGNYQVWLEDPAGHESGRLSPKSFLVEVPRHEWENPVLSRDTLESLSAATRGSYFGLHEIDAALRSVEGEVREKLTGEPQRAELWSSFPALLLFLVLLSAEWLLRKRYNLI